MADIAKSGSPSLSTIGPAPGSCKLPTLTAGEALGAFDACYIKNDGKVYKSTGAAANAAAKVNGFAPDGGCPAGEAVTLLFNVSVRYGAALTPGAQVYLSGATAGALADAASTGGTAPIGFVVDATRIYLYQSRY
jgi:hypothetical protein